MDPSTTIDLLPIEALEGAANANYQLWLKRSRNPRVTSTSSTEAQLEERLATYLNITGPLVLFVVINTGETVIPEMYVALKSDITQAHLEYFNSYLFDAAEGIQLITRYHITKENDESTHNETTQGETPLNLDSPPTVFLDCRTCYLPIEQTFVFSGLFE